MDSLRTIIARTAQPGRVTWIGVRPARRVPMTTVSRVICDEQGLAGDRSTGGKRAVTLIQAEHLPAIASYLGRESVQPGDLRRNIVISGLNLSSLKGRRIQIGTAVLDVTGICAPCSRMEETFGHGGYAAVRGHGGWCARVAAPGTIGIGDPVTPV